MALLAAIEEPSAAEDPCRSRPALPQLLRTIAQECGADRYLLADFVQDRERSLRITASNWLYDDVLALGTDALARIFQPPFSTFPGAPIRPLRRATLSAVLEEPELAALEAGGHAELYCFRLPAGAARCYVLLSSARPGRMPAAGVLRAQLECCHALCAAAGDAEGASVRNPLAERERECLQWVAQGKTTDEVAVIVGVSANTVNSYVAHAISKLSARNRAMAVAIAIRRGIL